MFDLFRFMLLRTPEKVDPASTITIKGDTTFTSRLRIGTQSQAPLVEMQAIAEAYAGTDDFVADRASLAHSPQYNAVSAHLATKTAGDLPALSTLIQKTFGLTPRSVAADKGFLSDQRRIQDSLVALQLLAATPQQTSHELLVQLCQVIDLIARVGQNDASLRLPGFILQTVHRLIVLPPGLFPVPSVLERQNPIPTADDTASARAVQARQDLSYRVIALKEALHVLNMLPIAAPRYDSSLPTTRSGTVAGAGPPAPTLVGPAGLSVLPSGSFASSRFAVAGLVDSQAIQTLSPSLTSLLAGLNLDLAITPLSAVSARVSTELMNAMDMAFIGATTPKAPDDPFHGPPSPEEWWDGPPAVLSNPPETFNAQVQPAGIADLLVVREHVLRYEPGEIAFVENVARGETFKRQTHRQDTSETSTLTTTFFGTETQRDLQATNRFDLQRHSQSVIQQKTDRVPGVGSSDAYGPLVDSGGSTEQSSSQASNYGQDVTSRAVNKLTQSLQTQVLQRATSEFDESTEHDFDNNKQPTDEIVVYQWLDKISQAQIFSYGKRTIYDFIVPEPAAFLVDALRKWQPALPKLLKPAPFKLWPQDMTRETAQQYAVGYGASGVQPPPEPRINVVRTYGNRASEPAAGPLAPPPAGWPASGSLLEVGEVGKGDGIQLPEGYMATHAVAILSCVEGNPQASATQVELAIGGQRWTLSTYDWWVSSDLPWQEVGHLPVTTTVFGPAEYTLSIDITCVPTAQYMAQWQARTRDIILQASLDRLAEYEDRLNNLKAALQVQTAGKTAEQKQVLVKAELEKACISILSNQHFDALNAIEFGPFETGNVPQVFLPNVAAVGRYIRFFEQAFEWDQMLYRYYPYFWGRKKYWNERLQLDDQDADFAAFLNAGAARVSLPVRKDYERSVARFMATGKIPAEAELLAVTTGMYVPFLSETRGPDGGPDSALPYGALPPWEIRVPTTLVKIRTDGTLPKWNRTTDSGGRVSYVRIAGDSVNP